MGAIKQSERTTEAEIQNKLNFEEREEMARENWRLVYFIARRYLNKYRDIETLVSAAHVGMTKALHAFEKSNGVKFSTYAAYCMEMEIFKELRKEKTHKDRFRKSMSSLNFIMRGGERDTELADFIAVEGDEHADVKVALKEVLDMQKPQNRSIYEEYLNGTSQRQLAGKYGMSQAHISRIVRRINSQVKTEYWENS